MCNTQINKEIKFFNDDIIELIRCVSFHDKLTGRIRVRPLEDQGLSTNLFLECSKDEGSKYPVRTCFNALKVKVCIKAGKTYLRPKGQMIYKIK